MRMLLLPGFPGTARAEGKRRAEGGARERFKIERYSNHDTKDRMRENCVGYSLFVFHFSWDLRMAKEMRHTGICGGSHSGTDRSGCGRLKKR
jgi:hypothetical protein